MLSDKVQIYLIVYISFPKLLLEPVLPSLGLRWTGSTVNMQEMPKSWGFFFLYFLPSGHGDRKCIFDAISIIVIPWVIAGIFFAHSRAIISCVESIMLEYR